MISAAAFARLTKLSWVCKIQEDKSMNEFFAKGSQICSARLRYPVLDSKENEGAAGTKESNWKNPSPASSNSSG